MSEIETAPVTAPVPPSNPEQAVPATSLFAGLSSSVSVEQVQLFAAALGAVPGLRDHRIIVAHPGAEAVRTHLAPQTDLLSYPLPNVDMGTLSPWAQRAAAQVALLNLAVEEQAAATVLLNAEPAGEATALSLHALAAPVLARKADLVVADYAHAPFDGLLNTGLLAPLSRALYGRRVQFPLAPDFALSPRMAARLLITAHGRGGAAAPVLWPVTCAAGIDAVVSEQQVGVPLPTPPTDMELRDVITQLVGSAFAEMEPHAPLWQRVRPTALPSVAGFGAVAGDLASGAAPVIDTTPMIQSFLVASRNLQDVWHLVLPPVTLLDLKRITLMPAERFTLPDELWVRIVYDFALAYRLRTLNRTHLLGALTPLYLGWVASFVRQTASLPQHEAAARAERLARAFEEGKPYLVRRWRWPDRFNP